MDPSSWQCSGLVEGFWLSHFGSNRGAGRRGGCDFHCFNHDDAILRAVEVMTAEIGPHVSDLELLRTTADR
jgi:hypothetical protein